MPAKKKTRAKTLAEQYLRPVVGRKRTKGERDKAIIPGKTPEDIATQFAQASAELLNGEKTSNILAKYDCVTAKDINFLKRWTGLQPEEFNNRIINSFEVIQAKILEELYFKMDEIPAQNLAYTLSVVSDKLATMQGKPSSISASVGIKVDGENLSQAKAIELLTG